jgi:hypothetical protein
MSSCFKDSQGKKLRRKRGPNKQENKRYSQIPVVPVVPEEAGPTDQQDNPDRGEDISFPSNHDVDALILRLNSNDEYEWSGGHRLSAIIEILEEESRRGSVSTSSLLDSWLTSNTTKLRTLNRDYNTLSRHLRSPSTNYSSYSNRPANPKPAMSGKGVSPVGARPIETPPRDVSVSIRMKSGD